VNRILEKDGRYAIEVAYGTSQVAKQIANVGSFVIMNYQSIQQIGLTKATRFELLTLQILPWTVEYFPDIPGRRTPIVGHLTNHEIIRLQQWSNMVKVIVAALTTNGGSQPKAPE